MVDIILHATKSFNQKFLIVLIGTIVNWQKEIFSGAIKKNIELWHGTDDKTYLPLLRKWVKSFSSYCS